MKNLKNTKEDKDYLYEIIKEKSRAKASIGLGVFGSDLVSSFKIIQHIGYITKIYIDTGYIEWVNMEGRKMPSVNINTVSLY